MHLLLEPLETEILAFKEQLPDLRQRLPIGTFVLFVGSSMCGSFTTYTQALEAGFRAAGSAPFLVKQISREGEDVQFVYGLLA